MLVEEVVEEAVRLENAKKAFKGSQLPWVCITGGEPLLQAKSVFRLVKLLTDLDVKVEIETNGSINPPIWSNYVDSWSIDVKCPSSHTGNIFQKAWITEVGDLDQLKFVVRDREDLSFVEHTLEGLPLLSPIVLVSPVIPVREDGVEIDNNWLKEVAEYCIFRNFRMSLQLHKIIWANKRGV